MKSKIFSSFLGGFLGILISGYAYYLTKSHHAWLVPLGTFTGCLIGFSWFNIKEIYQRANKIASILHFRIFSLEKLEMRFASFKLEVVKTVKTTWELICQTISFFKKTKKTLKKLITKIQILAWFKKHPMNGYRVLEVIVIAGIYIALFLLIRKLGAFELINSISQEDPIWKQIGEVAISFSLLGPIASLIVYITKLSGDITNEEFYSDFEFYQKWSIFGIILKATTKIIFSSVIAAIFIVSIMLGGMSLLFAAMIIVMINLLIAAVAHAFEYLARLARDKKELSALINTLIVTTICYFAYRSLFDNQLMIWLVAFMTGSFSALSVILVSKISQEKIKKLITFIDSDDGDPFEKKTYKKSLAGILVFAPISWLINIMGNIADKNILIYEKISLMR